MSADRYHIVSELDRLEFNHCDPSLSAAARRKLLDLVKETILKVACRRDYPPSPYIASGLPLVMNILCFHAPDFDWACDLLVSELEVPEEIRPIDELPAPSRDDLLAKLQRVKVLLAVGGLL